MKIGVWVYPSAREQSTIQGKINNKQFEQNQKQAVMEPPDLIYKRPGMTAGTLRAKMLGRMKG